MSTVPQIENALRALNGSDNARLEVFGATPLWTVWSSGLLRIARPVSSIHPVEAADGDTSLLRSRVSRNEL